MRVDFHPDQFCVLNSTNKFVFYNTINILEYHYRLLDMMNIKNKVLVLHVGSGVLGKDKSSKRFVNNFNKLKLPIYEVTYSKTGKTNITNEFDSLNNNKYKLVDKVKCKYDLCYWYDYNVSKIASAKWIYYDNNESNEGGYYIFIEIFRINT